MPFCPNCNYEYVEGILICPDCNQKLVDILELEKFEELSEKDWVLIYTSFNEIDIEMIKDNLESAGISTSSISQKDSVFPVPGNLSLIKLFVKKADVSEALEFIDEMMKKINSDEEENGTE
jgi:pentatricopeptide repeat protein